MQTSKMLSLYTLGAYNACILSAFEEQVQIMLFMSGPFTKNKLLSV